MTDIIKKVLNKLKEKDKRGAKQEISLQLDRVRNEIKKQKQISHPDLGITPQQLNYYQKLQQKLQGNHELISLVKIIQSVDESISRFESAFLQEESQALEAIIHHSNVLEKSLSAQQKTYQFNKLYQRIQKIEPKCLNQFKDLIRKIDLPLKRGSNATILQIPVQQTNQILLAFHSQYCLKILKHAFCQVLQKASEQNSILVEYFWQKTAQTVDYLFLSNHEKTHKIDQPQLLLEYLQEVVGLNYKCLLDLFSAGKTSGHIVAKAQAHFASQTYKALILPAIIRRANADLTVFNPFLAYHFLHQVHLLQKKLLNSYGQIPCFMEPLLLQAPALLDLDLHFQDQRFQEKVFCDIYNINYSKINLKNIDAFNVVCNFSDVFEFFYTKFNKIKNEKINERINNFYLKLIYNLCAHIKTSFERIFQYCDFPKCDVILAYQRVQVEFCIRCGSFLKQNKIKSINQQFYGFLRQSIIVYANQLLNPIHKKIINQLEIISPKFKEIKGDQIKNDNFNRIFQQWIEKMENIKIVSDYSDVKLRKLFFTFLEDLSFSQLGLSYFFSIFEQFLKVILSTEGYNTLLNIMKLQKNERALSIEAQTNIKLNQKEIDAICKVDFHLN